MKIVQISLGEHAVLTGYLHEPVKEFSHIAAYKAMLVVPGGGFRFCSPREGEPVAMAYYAKGYQAFVLDYTTVIKKPDATIADPMKDAENALLHIRSHAAEYLLDPEKVAMIGFSGGSHLAAAVSTHGPQRPNVLLLGYPGIIHSALRALECPDILESVDSRTPPTFLFVTRNDKVTPPKHALAFAQALDAADVDYELHIFKNGPHGMSLATAFTAGGEAGQVNPVFAQWFELSVEWLTEMLGEYTIYGVNDGRNSRFNIDKTCRELKAADEAWALVQKYVPVLSKVLAAHPDLEELSVRSISGFMPLDSDAVAELDRELLQLG